MCSLLMLRSAVGLLIHYPYVINYGVIAHTVDFHIAGLWMTYLSVVFSLSSAFGYVRGFVRANRHKRIGASSPP